MCIRDRIKKADGTWAFDYKIFDEYVELAMECGIDEAITLYTPIPWGFRHRYKDEATGDYSYINWTPSSKEFKKMWNIFLTDFKFHLEAKSWLDTVSYTHLQRYQTHERYM